MKNIISVFALMLSIAACKAQIYPLNTFYKNVPNNSYLKDLNHILPPYIGTYKATYLGNEITLFITKENKKPILSSKNKQYYQDVLNVNYIIKELSTGVILQDTRNQADPKRNKIVSIGTNTKDNNSIALVYSGTNCGVGNGSIKLTKPSRKLLSWSFYPDASLLAESSCPDSLDLKVYLPAAENLIFTKQ